MILAGNAHIARSQRCPQVTNNGVKMNRNHQAIPVLMKVGLVGFKSYIAQLVADFSGFARRLSTISTLQAMNVM